MKPNNKSLFDCSLMRRLQHHFGRQKITMVVQKIAIACSSITKGLCSV